MDDYFEEEKHQGIMRTQQKKLFQILSLNQTRHGDNTRLEQYGRLFVWKVLVYDTHTKRLVNLLLKVGDMRSHNVSLFLSLETKRDVIRNVAAVYLIKPCKESIDHLIEDLNSKLYDYVFVNFISPCPSSVLENLAIECGRYNNQNCIIQIYEHHLNYFTITNDMFSLNFPDAYLSLHRKYELKAGMDSYLEAVAEGIYMAMRSNSWIPYILFDHKYESCEKVSSKLCELFANFKKLEEEKYEFKEPSRPLLVLLDRNVDLHTMLHHPWKYVSLVHDVFGIDNGRVVGLQDKGKKVDYELNFLDDQFLLSHILADYPEVAGDISAEFNKWKHEYDSMTENEGKETKDVSSKLNEALDQVPEMTERKIALEAHTNITTLLYDQVKKRDYDRLNDLETQIMTSTSISSKVLLLLIHRFREK
eukprot:TRINITY_DN9842_c0_g3_i6.p1 TRINITY_DN9842_c0_g3~~TRINITY_DN9842_c0_g3_i6.p1  ORF type:complete len:419 (-),score=123.16 TRINITY_DN9842_c0_g3_i6:856-2112(-)